MKWRPAAATVFAPASIGNVGPGFDALGLCVEGLGDLVTVELTGERQPRVAITGRDAALVPTADRRNAAAIAAAAFLRARGDARHPRVTLHKGLPLSGGLGGSAASSVGGALAAAFALRLDSTRATVREQVLLAACHGEAAVSGEHYDNVAACLLGGLTLVRSSAPLDVVALTVRRRWWVALASPGIRVETKHARAALPQQVARSVLVHQVASCAALVHAFAQGDAALAGRALDDRFAEPARAALIPHFAKVKAAAHAAGAIGCSISGAGPTVFALARSELTAHRSARAMQQAFEGLASTVHVGRICARGAHRVD